MFHSLNNQIDAYSIQITNKIDQVKIIDGYLSDEEFVK
jgi:hypothetical protein